MRVLLLTQVLPYPPDSGPKVKTWNVLKYLAARHDVTLISFVRGDQSKDVEHLKHYCQQVFTVPMDRGPLVDGLAMARSILGRQPWMMLRDERRAMVHLLSHLADAGSFDVVHADQLNMAQYALRVKGKRRVLDAHNALWLLYRRLAATMAPNPRRWLLERDWRLLKTYEGRMVRTFDSVLAVSEEDRAALLEAAGEQREIAVIPIAVDTDEVQPVVRVAGGNHILHMGTMYWPANIDGVRWFIREILPLIRRERPDVVLDIVGARPPTDLLVLSGSDSGVKVTDYVEDPTPYLEQAGVFIVPLRAGGGMRVKILNAMAQGLPIVSTTLGAEGLAVRHEEELLLADTPRDFAKAVLRLLQDQTLAARLGSGGRQLVEQQYDYRVACQPLEALYSGD
jgi:polysaccharide biosynthesis protein PslH